MYIHIYFQFARPVSLIRAFIHHSLIEEVSVWPHASPSASTVLARLPDPSGCSPGAVANVARSETRNDELSGGIMPTWPHKIQ